MNARQCDVRVGSVRSPVLEWGPGTADRQAVVFVHGNPGSSRDWEQLGPQVGEFVRSIAPDMPGFGGADKPRDFDYTVQGYARHLDGIMEALGVLRAHLVLHDFGGPWGLAWAAAHPERVGSLMLIDTGLLLGYRWHYLARIWRTPLLGELFMATTTRTSFRLLLRHGNPRGLPSEFVDRMYADFDRGTRRAVLRLYRATDPGRGPQLMAAALRRLSVPVLVLWGRHDPYVPVSQAWRQREVFPEAETAILERSGHWPFMDDPEGTVRIIMPFLRRSVAS